MSTDPTPPTRSTGLADRLVIGGGVVFIAGLLALAVVMVIFAEKGSSPGALAGLALLCPIGFAISFWGLVVQARERRRS